MLRFVHLLAAVAWIGGSLFYAVALRPQLQQDGLPQEARRAIAARFRAVVQACIAAFILTGVPLAFDRLSQSPSLLYAGLLWLKIGLSLWMLLLAYSLRLRVPAARPPRWGNAETPGRGESPPRLVSGARRRRAREENLVLALGLLILLVVAALRVTYESALR